MLPFFAELGRVLATVDEGDFNEAVWLARKSAGTVYFIGNGGSAAIASHMAIDWMNKGGFKTRDLNNPAALTCLANDYGYQNVFVRQLGSIGAEDLLIAISSSGSSPNIIRAARGARKKGARIIVFTGFAEDNGLRQYGLEFHIPSDNYAIIENAHMAILHAMLEVLR